MSASERISYIDNDLLDALLQPALQAHYARDSHAFVRIDTSLRVYWHTIFDTCPSLLQLSDPDGMAIYRPFMAWAHQRHLSMNWALFVWLHEWLRQSSLQHHITPALTEMLMAASAARWAVSDRSRQSGIVIAAQNTSAYIAAWKCRRVDQGRQIERFELAQALPPHSEQFAYCLVPAFEFDHFDCWQSIPN